MLRFTNQKKVLVTTLICCLVVGVAFALTMDPILANTLWDSGVAADEFGNQFVELYKQWFFPVLIVNIAVYVISKNDKVKGASKVVAIGLCVLYIICAMSDGGENFVTGTLDKVAEWFN